MDKQGLPIGFGMALAMNDEALKRFSSMTDAEKHAVIQKARLVNSKSEMQQLVAGIADRTEG